MYETLTTVMFEPSKLPLDDTVDNFSNIVTSRDVRAQLGLKAPAWARLWRAQACKICEPGLHQRLGLGLGLARLEPRLWYER